MGWEGIWPNRHIAFIVAKKLNLQLCCIYGICGRGVGWKRHMGGRGLAENVRIPSYRGEEV